MPVKIALPLVAILFFANFESLPAQDGTVLLDERFGPGDEGALPRGWQAKRGIWRVEKGILVGRPGKGSKEATLLLPEFEARDLSIEADLVFLGADEPTRWLALLAREGKERAGAQFTARMQLDRSNGAELAAKKDGSIRGWRVFQTARVKASFAERKPHRLRLELEGNEIRGFLDGAPILNCPRASELSPSGACGLRLSGAVLGCERIVVRRLKTPSGPKTRAKPPRRPFVVAHRGDSAAAPENTLVAYEQAIAAGAEMAECDVRLSRDRVPVLLHDQSLKRTTGRNVEVGKLPWSELKDIDAGAWKHPRYRGEKLPSLKQALALVKDRLNFIVEIKDSKMERETLAAVRASGCRPESVVFFCFKREVVVTLARMAADIPSIWLIGELPCEPAARRAILLQAGRDHLSGIGLPKTRVDPEFVRSAQTAGLKVFVWTVNDPADMRYLRDVGVDAIITDRPARLREILAEND